MFLFIFVVSNIGLLITIILNNNSNKKNKNVAQYTLHDEQEACFECKDKKQDHESAAQEQIEILTQIIRDQKSEFSLKIQSKNEELMKIKYKNKDENKKTLEEHIMTKLIHDNNTLYKTLGDKNKRLDEIIQILVPGNDSKFMPCLAKIFKC